MSLLCFKLNNVIKNDIKTLYKRAYCKKPPWKVLFFGTDKFSIFSLEALTKKYRKGDLIEKLEVVSTIKGKPNPVKIFSDREKLTVHKWPLDIPKGEYDVGLVVSFGHLIPEHIIDKFQYGMLNVHASLLPRWRGAAPIIYALANGDTQTGVTIMKISPKKFDIGEIVSQSAITITPTMKMPELYYKLGTIGAQNLVETLKELPSNIERCEPQPSEGVSYAPKVDITFAQIDWESMTSERIYNLSRALETVFPLQTKWKESRLKLVNIKLDESPQNKYQNLKPGFIEFDKKKEILRILCKDFKFIIVENVGIVGKKIISAKDFNNGYLKKEPIDCRYFK